MGPGVDENLPDVRRRHVFSPQLTPSLLQVLAWVSPPAGNSANPSSLARFHPCTCHCVALAHSHAHLPLHLPLCAWASSGTALVLCPQEGLYHHQRPPRMEPVSCLLLSTVLSEGLSREGLNGAGSSECLCVAGLLTHPISGGSWRLAVLHFHSKQNKGKWA